MSLGGRLREQVTIYNRVDATSDIFGDPTDSFDEGTSVHAFVQPQSSNESITDRDSAVSGYRVTFGPNTDVFLDSEIEWNDRRMRVTGRPEEYLNHQGIHHIEITAEYVET